MITKNYNKLLVSAWGNFRYPATTFSLILTKRDISFIRITLLFHVEWKIGGMKRNLSLGMFRNVARDLILNWLNHEGRNMIMIKFYVG